MNIAIIMGGYGNEYNISLKSGEFIFKNIDYKKYNPYKIFILKNKWVYIDDNGNEYNINKHDFSIKKQNKKIKFDVVFNIIHGHPGENGCIQAYFELLNIPYTGSNFYTSALTFNKNYCIQILKRFGIKTAPSFFLDIKKGINIERILKQVGIPCIVKPNRSGSSIGITKVIEKDKLIFAIEKASYEDTEILIEKFLSGTELSVGVLEYKKKIKVLPITEIISNSDFFDYEAKYFGKGKEITPADISSKIEKKIYKLSKKIFILLGINGLARSEYIIVNDIPYFLEINTIPGFTKESIFPKQINMANISLTNIINDMIQKALNKN